MEEYLEKTKGLVMGIFLAKHLGNQVWYLWADLMVALMV